MDEPYVVIGRLLNTIPVYQAKLYRNSLFRHVLITGTTGSGKSNTASVIARRVSENLGVRVVILDWHSEYENILGDHQYIDPFNTPLELFTGDPNDLSVLSSIFELTSPQEYLLDKVIKKTPVEKLRELEDLLNIIESYPEEASWMRETKLSLHRKLSLLTRESYRDLFTMRREKEIVEILERYESKPFVLDLGSIRDLSIRRLYGAFFAKRIVDHTVEKRTSLVLIVEEAQNYLSRTQPIRPLCDMLREVRKFGIGLVVVSQSLSQLVDDVSTNTNTKIIHTLKSSQDLEVVERTLYLEKELLETIPYMEPGEAVYSSPYLKKPVLIKIEKDYSGLIQD